MFKRKNEDVRPQIKSKTMEVSSKALIGKTELDKAIEKYTNEGWILVEKTKVRNKDRYTLRFEYEMSLEEAATENRNKWIKRGIVTALLFGCCMFSYAYGQIQQAQAAPTETQQAIDNLTSIAQFATNEAIVSRTAVRLTATAYTGATLTATLSTSTPTKESSATPTVTTTLATSTPSPTQRPTITPRPTDRPPTTTFYALGSPINARECAQLSCAVLHTYSYGDVVDVVRSTTGDSVSGTGIWYQAIYNDQTVYVHSSVIARSLPTAQPASSSSSSGSTTNAQNAAPAESGCSCSTDLYNCRVSDFRTQAQAQACYDKCLAERGFDVHRLDGNDNDGRACEDLP